MTPIDAPGAWLTAAVAIAIMVGVIFLPERSFEPAVTRYGLEIARACGWWGTHRNTSKPVSIERENDLRQQAAVAYQLAAQAKMAKDRASWFALAERWEQLAAAEATKRDDNSQRS